MDDIQKLLFNNQVKELLDKFPKNENETLVVLRLNLKQTTTEIFLQGQMAHVGIILMEWADDSSDFKSVLLSSATAIMVTEN